MSAVFHLFAIFVNVVEPEDMSTWRTRFSKVRKDCSSTCARRGPKRLEFGPETTQELV